MESRKNKLFKNSRPQA